MINQRQVEELLSLIKDNDNKAFEELYYLIDKCVYAYVLAIIKNRSLAEDIMQDTFVKIRNCSHLYIAKGKPLAWIFKIAKNLCLMEIRKNQNTVVADVAELLDHSNGYYDKDIEENLLLQKALSKLNQEEREVVFLHAISGFKHKEIAQITDIPLGTVLWRYNKSLKKLKSIYLSL